MREQSIETVSVTPSGDERIYEVVTDRHEGVIIVKFVHDNGRHDMKKIPFKAPKKEQKH